jgi:sugar lactone lactonase YvrE
MGARELCTLLEGGHYFESPRWHDGRWWVSDFYRHTVFTVEPDGTVEDILTLEGDGQPSGLGWLPDGSLLVVSMLDHRLLRRAPDGTVSEHADVSEHCGPVARVAPGGEIVDEIPLPDGLAVFACMLGGEDGKTLLMCAAPDFAQEARKAAREAILFTTTVDVPRADRP